MYEITSMITLGLSYYLIPSRGLTGVGIAWLIAQCTVLLIVVGDWIKGKGYNLQA
jgi:hypothetical protein